MSSSMKYWDSVETMPREKLEALQTKRLIKQIGYVLEHSRFYQTKFKDAGLEQGDIRNLEDLEKIPLTTKEELRKAQVDKPPYGSHVCVDPDQIVWSPTTSGTSGVPLIIPRNRHDIKLWTDLNARAFTAMGMKPTDVYQQILGYHFIFSGFAMHLGAQSLGANVINAGMGNTQKQIWTMKNLNSTVAFATPSYFTYLGTKLQESGENKNLKLRIATGGGEVGMNTPAGKKRIRELFPTVRTVADIGGTTDVGTIIWGECREESGGHLCEDSIYIEVLDPETMKPVPPGTEGELVLTDLVSQTAPLIRYRVKDLTVYDPTPCPCGRTIGRLPQGVMGRVDDRVTVKSCNVYPSAVDEIVKSIEELNGEYQIIVDRPKGLDLLTIRAEYKPGITDLEAVKKKFEKKAMVAWAIAVELQLEPPMTLPRFTYKASRLIDMRKGQTLEDAEKIAKAQESV
jgi:phenylacetate-CoA ligase